MRPAGRFHNFSAFAAWSGLSTRRSPGRAWERVPTSRTVPHADGWPVSDCGPSPGAPVTRGTATATSPGSEPVVVSVAGGAPVDEREAVCTVCVWAGWDWAGAAATAGSLRGTSFDPVQARATRTTRRTPIRFMHSP